VHVFFAGKQIFENVQISIYCLLHMCISGLNFKEYHLRTEEGICGEYKYTGYQAYPRLNSCT
jgi:hypothetical protein